MSSRDQLKGATLAQLAAIDREHSALKMRERHAQFGGGATDDDYAQFNSMCLSSIERIAARGSTYYQQALRELDHQGSLTSAVLSAGLYALASSLKQDIQGDMTATFQEIENARILEEFLAMADVLVIEGCLDGALVLAGSVLQSHLRHLAVKHDIRPPRNGAGQVRRATAGEINAALTEVAYAGDEGKKVSISLSAFHQVVEGHSEDLSKQSVNAFIRYVRAFMEAYPA